MRAQWLGVLVLPLICADCVPFKAYDLPEVSGVVRDDVSKAPILGAQISVKSKMKDGTEAHAVSDAAGHFKISEITHTVWLPPLPYDMFIPDCVIHISAMGYADQQFDFYDSLKAQRQAASKSDLEFDLKHN